MDPRSKMVPMLSTGGVIGPLIGISIGRPTGEMAVSRVVMMEEIGVTLVVVNVANSEGVPSILCAVEVYAGM